ncbi:hypothetical protein IFT37_18850 [Pseudomonas fluorescens]|uniref:hypothetical protein n=1 Tax=Pseudomonas fluorescens TaxID=294 RepID=UPI0017864305|nr:hypothetical protein [Pseudomonas fluorescens]MBD8147918.1 hypothetical protein [Pseudomonas fluorescens]MBD8177816.1 hypothetical protein [Pseudomonas fluorescens]MBD8747171.1 hypothetical protein [Pseudomonas fluorescens]MBD8750927.1 hypothetical protein [Pseudomonas fluorescens]MBD8760585.1 hypothetical protein [Pseudomonas fluorescens]
MNISTVSPWLTAFASQPAEFPIKPPESAPSATGTIPETLTSSTADPYSRENLLAMLSELKRLMDTLQKGMDAEPVTPETPATVETTPPSAVRTDGTQYLSNKRNKQKPDDVLGGLFFSPQVTFRSLTTPHSSHVAGIKLAMQHFGQSPTDIYAQVTPLSTGFNVTMRDGFKLFITHKELDLARESSQLLGNEDMLKDANFLYATLTKRKQLESNDPAEQASYPMTLRNTNNGEHASNVLKLMGLEKHMQEVKSESLGTGQRPGITVVSNGESMLVVDGREDFHGTPSRLRLKKQAYVLSDLPATTRLDGRKEPSIDSRPAPVAPLPPQTNVIPLPTPPGPPSPGAMPDLSSKRGGERPVNIMTAFNDTPRRFGEFRETAAYVDAIKLMMMKFGQSPTDCFQRVAAAGDGYDVTMKDGYEVHISRQEIQRAGQALKLSGDDSEMIKDANFIFAAFTKRHQLEHEDPVTKSDFETALSDAIQNGRHIKPILENIGMIGHMRHVHVSELEGQDTVGFLYGFGLVLGNEKAHQYLPYDGHGYVLDVH